MDADRQQKAVNRAAARFIPALLVAILAYATWVVVDPLCIHYFLSPPPSTALPPKRTGACIAVVVLHFVSLLPVLVTYARLFQTVIADSGYIPQGSRPAAAFVTQNPEPSEPRQNTTVSCAPTTVGEKPQRSSHAKGRPSKPQHTALDYEGILKGYLSPPPGLERFYRRDVFGVTPSVHWIVAIALAALFTSFTLGMSGTSIHLATQNLTTIENIDRMQRRMYLAVRVPDGDNHRLLPSEGSTTTQPSKHSPLVGSIAYPLTQHGHLPPRLLEASSADHHADSSTSRLEPGNRSSLAAPTEPARAPLPPPRLFAILLTPPGVNPWDLGSAMSNLKEVMGHSWVEWLLPVRRSPCAIHPAYYNDEKEAGKSSPRSGRDEVDRLGGAEFPMVMAPATSTVWATRKESMKKVDANTGDEDDDGGPPLTVLMKTLSGPRAQTF
ncbi:hypothetical protein B0A49_03643 [Cryomyces minteri]|uniref:Protein S-acyltransferase n=1 Tax=Cryomyces minteri TaxID=331657 RepID=A0A4U0XLJ0_9PEZI|nr:hypothetical protein B0A49_03643 [Cryomyces minteri]